MRVVLRPFGAAPAAPTAVVGAFPATMAPAAAVPSASATGANDADAAAAMEKSAGAAAKACTIAWYCSWVRVVQAKRV